MSEEKLDSVSTDAEKEKASQQGWSEDYKGDPENFRTAKDFLAKGKEIAGIQTERVENLAKQNEELLTEIKSMKDDFK
ncbi:unnamed protein product, partial [marine sediment metagenome]